MLKSGSKNNLVIVSEIATGSSYTQSVSIELTSCYVSAYIIMYSHVLKLGLLNSKYGIVYAK